MTHRLYIDIETYATVDLRNANVYRYAADPEFLILMAAYAVDDDPVQVVTDWEAIESIPDLWNPSVVKVAHNAQFERICFSEFTRELAGMLPYDAPMDGYLPPEDWHDTMAVAAEYGYPQGLDQLAEALGAERKDGAGTVLINFFCKPNRKGQRNLPEDHPEKWAAFVEYCRQDVVALRGVDRKLGDFPTPMERAVYLADQRVNDRGIKVDAPLARAAVLAAEDNRMVQELELSSITGASNPGSREQLLAGVASIGLDLPDLKAKTVEAALARDDLDPAQRRGLELRQDLALVAAKKFGTALDAMNEDSRLRGGFRFFGAHTGRWAGRGVQPHNLPREQLDTELDTEMAILDLLLTGETDARTLKALVRALFVGPFTVSDYSSIEARVISWLAGEQWALDAFYAGRDIYVETAKRMGGLTRSQGKVAVLALGFNGGIKSLQAMGAQGDDGQLQFLVDQWRAANPAICAFWKTMGEAFRLGGPVGPHITIEKDGSSRYMRLPSGRAIGYHDCRFEWTETRYGPKMQPSFRDSRRGWQQRTYGGRLSENATQAVARDILAEALVRVDAAGHAVVGHVHDEMIVEGEVPLEELTRLMTVPPDWADGLPIDAAGFSCRRYRKG